jgi:GTP cyclohydrolase II
MTTTFEVSVPLPTSFGDFSVSVFTDAKGLEHMAIVKGVPKDNCLVRLHSECATGDIMGSKRCDCRNQLEKSLHLIDEAGEGLLIYLRGHEGRGIGLANKIKAYALQDLGLDTVEANVKLGFKPDQRDFTAAIDILRHFGLRSIRLLTNNKSKVAVVEEGGIKVSEQVSLWTVTNPYNERYLATKRTKMGHV